MLEDKKVEKKEDREKELRVEEETLFREEVEGRVESTDGGNECFSTRKGESLFFTFPLPIIIPSAISPSFLRDGLPRMCRMPNWFSLWVISPAACHFSGAPVRKRLRRRMKGKWEILPSWYDSQSPWREHVDVLPSGLPPSNRDDVTRRAFGMQYDATSTYFLIY